MRSAVFFEWIFVVFILRTPTFYGIIKKHIIPHVEAPSLSQNRRYDHPHRVLQFAKFVVAIISGRNVTRNRAKIISIVCKRDWLSTFACMCTGNEWW